MERGRIARPRREHYTMSVITIVGQPKTEDAWLHRFRNFGEEVYVKLRDSYAVSLDEIDASVDTFHVRDVPPEHATTAAERIERILGKHHLDDSVFILQHQAERSGFPVVLVVDPACGDQLWEIAASHDTWVVPSDLNRAAVEEIWEARKEQHDEPTLTIWSAPRAAETEDDWLGMLGTIEIHHGADACEPPLDTLSVYGAAVTPPITAALRENDYDAIKPTNLGFIAFKRSPA
jgi:hypothetical protein